MAKKDLSERQKNILQYIADYIADNTRPPTIREIGRNVKISSTSVVNYNLTRLVEKGMIERESEVSRGLRLTDKARKFLGFSSTSKVVNGSLHVPFLGAIVAGEPIESFEGNGEDMVEIGANLFGDATENLFALKVKGDSMIEAGINDGDIVVIEEGDTADNGDIVVALVEDQEATLKRLRRKAGMIALEAANPAYETRVFRDDQVKVQGKLVGLIRTY